MSGEPPERHVLGLLARHRLLWPIMIALALFLAAAALRLAHWAAWWP